MSIQYYGCEGTSSARKFEDALLVLRIDARPVAGYLKEYRIGQFLRRDAHAATAGAMVMLAPTLCGPAAWPRQQLGLAGGES